MNTSLLNRAWNEIPPLRPFVVDTVVQSSDTDAFPDLETELLLAATRRSTYLWRHFRVGCAGDGDGSRAGMHVATVAEPFGWVCERYHVHEREDEQCDLTVPHRSSSLVADSGSRW